MTLTVIADPPVNVSVEVSYLGKLILNSTVNLTCSSAANPAVYNYTWYKGTAPSFNTMIQVGSGQVLSIPSVEAFHTGLYLCNARNHLGGKNSSEVLLTVEETDSEYTGDTDSFTYCPAGLLTRPLNRLKG